MADSDDPRPTGEAHYLIALRLRWCKWWSSRPPDSGGDWDHDHCEFCWCHFGDHIFADDPGTQLAGYATEDGAHWICRSCFEDFKDRFGWVIEEPKT